jgi:hypothetical protein
VRVVRAIEKGFYLRLLIRKKHGQPLMDGQQVIFAKHPFGYTGLIGHHHQPKVQGKQAQCLGDTGQYIYALWFA